MRAKPSRSTQALLAMLALAALAVVFWILLLGPKREHVDRLGSEVAAAKAAVARYDAEVAEAEAARSEFAAEYRRLVVLGKAVPESDEVASLLVQLNRIADRAGGSFRDLELTAAGGGGAAPTAVAGSSGSAASATEAAASLLPLGATIGSAGLATMPYDVTFDGNFFQIADFIHGLDSLVESGGEGVRVDGRLVTIDGFSLKADPKHGFPRLQADFSLTTYLTPPGSEISMPASGAGGTSVGGTSTAATGVQASAIVGGAE